jgi:hypothetical protein
MKFGEARLRFLSHTPSHTPSPLAINSNASIFVRQHSTDSVRSSRAYYVKYSRHCGRYSRKTWLSIRSHHSSGTSTQTIPTVPGDTYRYIPKSYLEDAKGTRRSMVTTVYPDDSICSVAPGLKSNSPIGGFSFCLEAIINVHQDCDLELHSPSKGIRYLEKATKGEELRLHTVWTLVRNPDNEEASLQIGDLRRGDTAWVSQLPQGSVASHGTGGSSREVR